jgi:hypothetical protein
MNPAIRRLALLGFVVGAICAPRVLSFGDEKQTISMLHAPSKSLPPSSSSTCTALGTITSNDPNWAVGTAYHATVDFGDGNAATAVQVVDALVCYSYNPTPTCAPDSAGNPACSIGVDGNSSKWFASSIIQPTAISTYVNITFWPRYPANYSAHPDGTGRGIIIVTLKVGGSLTRAVSYLSGGNPFTISY